MAPNIRELADKVISMAADLSRESNPFSHPSPQPQWRVMLAGATAGLVVDTSLYPVDTIKSRLQSGQGFVKSGGFKNLYRGLMPVLVGSVPNGEYEYPFNNSIFSQCKRQCY